jgi:hypothetical protein
MRFKLCEIECFCKLAVVKMYYFAIDRQVEMLYLLLPPQGGKQLWSLKIGSQQSAFGSQPKAKAFHRGEAETRRFFELSKDTPMRDRSAEPHANLRRVVEPCANLG